MISFYPGPSRVHKEIPAYVKDAYREGILSINHRSDIFMAMAEKTILLLRKKLTIPAGYTVFFTGSATECWEIIAQSVVSRKSYHLYNGAFGQKWFEYTRRIRSGARPYVFERNEVLNPKKYRFGGEDGVICITQNETSNGTQVSMPVLKEIRERHPNHLLAVDATSSMGGIHLDFSLADIWLASVQKCFGLPAGLGLLICSPAALKQATALDDRKFYNSLPFMKDMMEKWQTPFTPNVLNIYLLMRVMEKVKPIETVHAKTLSRYKKWAAFFRDRETLAHLIEKEEPRSYTVIPVTGLPDTIKRVKEKALKKKILLGEGYGDLKASTFRIANFPALRKSEIKTLMDFLSHYH